MDGPAVRLEPRAADRGGADHAARHRFGGSAGGRRSRSELARPVTGWRSGFRRMAAGVWREVMSGLRGVGDWGRARSQSPAATATGTAARSWRQTEPAFGGGHELTYLFVRQTIKSCPRRPIRRRRPIRGRPARPGARPGARCWTPRRGCSLTRGLAGVSAAEIAREAGAFPSQVTYYFGSKEALFVEAACRAVLHAAAEIERAGASARSPRSYVRAVVDTALADPALLSFVEATVLVRRRPDLAPRVRETFARLHAEGERAIVENLAARGWGIRSEPAAEAHGFWATILGVVLERSAQDGRSSRRSAEAAVALVLSLYTEPDRQARDADA